MGGLFFVTALLCVKTATSTRDCRIGSPSKGVITRLDASGTLSLGFGCGNSGLLRRSSVNMILDSKVSLNGGPGITDHGVSGRERAVRTPFCHRPDVRADCRRLGLGLGGNFNVVLQTCSRKITCQFCARQGNGAVVLGRATTCRFNGSGGT